MKLVFDWRIKIFLEKIVSFIPFGLDYKIYYYFGQKFLGINSYYPKARIEKGLENLEILKKYTDFNFEKSTVLELGTGLSGIDLILLYLLGCGRIISVDHLSHLKRSLFTLSITAVEDKILDISNRFSIDVDVIKERYRIMKKNGSLGEILASCNIELYEGIVPNLAKLKPNSIDLFFSESCLQRIPVEDLDKIFGILPNLLSKNTVSFHRLDTKDFNAIYFSKLWGLNYLKYCDFTWSIITSKKFNNQNRLREFEFIKYLEDAGLKTIYVESYLRKEDIEKLKKIKLAERFQNKPLEEIAVIASKIISSKQYDGKTKRMHVTDFK